MSAKVQVIEKDGRPEYAVVPIEFYRHLLALAEDAEDIRAADEAMRELADDADELIPADVAHRLLSCDEHPLRVWREFRGLTQQALAEQVGIGKSYVSQIEAGKKVGTARVLKALAEVLQVDMDNLIAVAD